MLEIGTKVFLKKTSGYYSQSKEAQGEIIGYNKNTDHIYEIKWSGGYSNVYREEDIENPIINYEIY